MPCCESGGKHALALHNCCSKVYGQHLGTYGICKWEKGSEKWGKIRGGKRCVNNCLLPHSWEIICSQTEKAARQHTRNYNI